MCHACYQEAKLVQNPLFLSIVALSGALPGIDLSKQTL